MTCIIGLVEKGKVYIGGDSVGANVRTYQTIIRRDRKVFKNGEFVIGFTSSFRMGQLLQYAFSPPKRHPDQDVFTYMATVFVNAVRDCFKTGGFAEKHNDAESGGMFLVGYQGRLFSIDSDYHVGEAASGFDACGCGESIALGAMYVSEGTPAKKRILDALAAAERYSGYVRGPFHVEAA